MDSNNSTHINSGLWQEWALAVLLIAPFIAFAIILPSLPAKVPMHFDARGNVNRYGSPWELLILPGINIILAVILYYIPRLDPKQENIAKSLSAYRWIRLFVAALFTYVFGLTLVTTFHPTFDVTPFIAIGLLTLYFVLGFAMPHIRQSYLIGIRLPWTLESEDNWNRTHAFAGKPWPWGSILGITLSVLFPTASLFIAMGILMVLVVWTSVFSYKIYKATAAKA